MTHEEIEAYIKSRDLDVMQYQLVLDAMYYAEDVIIKKACEWLKHQEEMIGVSFEEDFIERFKNAMGK